jgi:hypothetical protein
MLAISIIDIISRIIPFDLAKSRQYLRQLHRPRRMNIASIRSLDYNEVTTQQGVCYGWAYSKDSV